MEFIYLPVLIQLSNQKLNKTFNKTFEPNIKESTFSPILFFNISESKQTDKINEDSLFTHYYP